MFDSLLATIVLTAVVGASALTYLLPVLVGWVRHVPDLGAVAVINILLGWTLVGWALALALALRTTHAGSAVVQVVQNLPTAPPRSPSLPSAGWAGPPGTPSHRPRHAAPPLDLPLGPAGSGESSGRG